MFATALIMVVLSVAQPEGSRSGQVYAPPPPPPANPLSRAPGARLMAPASGLIGEDDYPQAAMWAGDQGITAFALEVSPSGLPGKCTITQSSGSAVLDAATCDLVRTRARFHPARTHKGAPRSDIFRSRVRWQLPPFADIEENFVTMDPDGRFRDCRDVLMVSGQRTSVVEGDCGDTEWLAELEMALGSVDRPARLLFHAQLSGPGEQPAEAPSGARELGRRELDLSVSPTGSITGCRATETGAIPPFDGCRYVSAFPKTRFGGAATSARLITRLFLLR